MFFFLIYSNITPYFTFTGGTRFSCNSLPFSFSTSITWLCLVLFVSCALIVMYRNFASSISFFVSVNRCCCLADWYPVRIYKKTRPTINPISGYCSLIFWLRSLSPFNQLCMSCTSAILNLSPSLPTRESVYYLLPLWGGWVGLFLLRHPQLRTPATRVPFYFIVAGHSPFLDNIKRSNRVSVKVLFYRPF